MSSIFGDVSQGVPNPVVPHAHPYPTRYHGMNLIQPQATFSYRESPYVVSYAPPVAMRGSPDGIGATAQEILASDGFRTAYSILSILGATTGAYHGYKRHDSVGWAIGWFLLGGVFPFLTIPLSLAEGYGQPHDRRVEV